MDFISGAIDFILHIDTYLVDLVADYGFWVYLILFLIIFMETGLVVVPFLPGDSLLFAVGALSAIGGLNIFISLAILSVAAILGDSVNYSIGKNFGRKLLGKSRLIKASHVEKTEEFYARHGAKAIVLARFMPIVRTFIPFVAGIGTMHYRKFLFYNVIGGLAWVFIFVSAGYFFGNVPFIKENFEYVIIAIILISLVPSVVVFIREKLKNRKSKVITEASNTIETEGVAEEQEKD